MLAQRINVNVNVNVNAIFNRAVRARKEKKGSLERAHHISRDFAKMNGSVSINCIFVSARHVGPLPNVA